MKQVTRFALLFLFLGVFACSKNEIAPENQISDAALKRIADLGFSTKDALKIDEGYIVEGDIFLSEDDLHASPLSVRIPQLEQYHTTNLVNDAVYSTIKVSISSQLPASYATALDEAIARYNAENLTITFQRVSSGADISIVRGNGSYLASAGFPTSTGAPHNQIKINNKAIGNGTSTTFINYVATILSHEIGHCIGFRHTDYMDRSYSCGGATANEGASTVGAVHIPGTPTTADPGSFMLACIGSNQNRPFNNNDKTALAYLY